MTVAEKAAVRKSKYIPSLDWLLRRSEQARRHDATPHDTKPKTDFITTLKNN
jgi:hypothetical protein